MISAQLKLVGDKALIRKLKRLDQRALRKILRPAIKAGLGPVLREARKLAPVRTGILKAALKSKVSSKGAVGKVYVDPSLNMEYDGRPYQPSKYAHLVEFGTRHSAPQPFMRPALAAKRGEALARITAKARANLAREAAR